ncbi:MAG: type II secretion system protein [Magnetococcales bacterium]|nr:type II secretion system protein [Magnetococcales bacterium]
MKTLSMAERFRGNPGWERCAGFTLVEILLVILIMGILTGISAPLIGNYVEAYLQARDLNGVTSQGRLAMARMTRELREGTDFVGTPFNSTQVQFTFGGSSVTYALNGSSQLTRTQSGVTAILADRVASVQFVSNNDTPPVKLIDITLAINRVRGGSISFSSSVSPRNPT